MSILCPKCTGKVDSYYKFCPKCGSPLVGDASKPASELVKVKKPLLARLVLYLGGAGVIVNLAIIAGALGGITRENVAKTTPTLAIILFGVFAVIFAFGLLLMIAAGKKRVKALREQSFKNGFAVSAETTGYHYCNRCGGDLPQNASYCVQCGRLAPEMPSA